MHFKILMVEMKQDVEKKIVGKISGAHGLTGELKVVIFSSATAWHDAFTTAFIDDQEYHVEKLRSNKTFWILKLSELNDRTASEALKGKDLWAFKSLFETEEDDDPYLSELVGFQIILNNKSVGTIHSFKETQAHFLLVIETINGFYEIPYVDSFIDEIQRKEHQILMSFPEDLMSEDYKLKSPE